MTTQNDIDLLIGQCNALTQQNQDLQNELRETKLKILKLEKKMEVKKCTKSHKK